MSCKKPTASRICKLFNTSGTIVAELKYNREDFRRFGFHSHPTFSLSALASGGIEIDFAHDTPVILRPGAVAFYPPERVHRTALLEGEAPAYYNLHIDPDYCAKLWGEEQSHPETFTPFWKMPILEDPRFYDHFLLLCRLILQEEASDRIEALLAALLRDLYAQMPHREIIEAPEDPLAESIARFLNQRLDDPPDLAELSRRFGYHPDVLNRRFKRRFGLSLRAYLIDRRLHRAKTMLLEGRHSVAQIAVETGFYDQSHFVKAFKKAYSLPPGEYR